MSIQNDNGTQLNVFFNEQQKFVEGITGLNEINLSNGESKNFKVNFKKSMGEPIARQYKVMRKQEGVLEFNRIDGWHYVANCLLKCFGLSSYRNSQSKAINNFCVSQSKFNQSDVAAFHQKDTKPHEGTKLQEGSEFEDSDGCYNTFTDSDMLLAAFSDDRFHASLHESLTLKNTPKKLDGKNVSKAFGGLIKDSEIKAVNESGLTEQNSWANFLQPTLNKHGLSCPECESVRLSGEDRDGNIIAIVKVWVAETGNSQCAKKYSLAFILNSTGKTETDPANKIQQQVWSVKLNQVVDENYNDKGSREVVSPTNVKKLMSNAKALEISENFAMASFEQKIERFKSEMGTAIRVNARLKDAAIDDPAWIQGFFTCLAQKFELQLVVEEPEAHLIQAGVDKDVQFSAKFKVKNTDDMKNESSTQSKAFKVTGDAKSGSDGGGATIWANVTVTNFEEL